MTDLDREFIKQQLKSSAESVMLGVIGLGLLVLAGCLAKVYG